MAMAIVQSAHSAGWSSGDPATNTASLTGVAAGSCIVAVVKQYEQAVRTYTVSDSVVGSYGAHVRDLTAGDVSQAIDTFAYFAHSGGNITVTATISAGAYNFMLAIFELSDVDVLLDSTGYSDTDTANANAYAAGVGGLTNAAECIAIAAVTSAYDATGYTAPTGYTNATGDANGGGAAAAKYFASGVSSERPAFTQTGTARTTAGQLLLFGASGGGGSTFVPQVIMVL